MEEAVSTCAQRSTVLVPRRLFLHIFVATFDRASASPTVSCLLLLLLLFSRLVTGILPSFLFAFLSTCSILAGAQSRPGPSSRVLLSFAGHLALFTGLLPGFLWLFVLPVAFWPRVAQCVVGRWPGNCIIFSHSTRFFFGRVFRTVSAIRAPGFSGSASSTFRPLVRRSEPVLFDRQRAIRVPFARCDLSAESAGTIRLIFFGLLSRATGIQLGRWLPPDHPSST